MTGQMTAGRIVDALMAKYGQLLGVQALHAEKWVCIPEARAGAGFDGNRRQCDLLAINTWKSHGVRLVGHEIKVTAADWRRELADADKAETFARYCAEWWVTVPSALAKQIAHEVPATWGLMAVSDTGKVRVVAKPQERRTPEPVPTWWWIGWLAQVDRRDRRAETAELDRLVRERVAAQLDRALADAVRRTDQRVEHLTQQLAVYERLEDVLGCRGRGIPEWQVRALGRVWPLLVTGPGLGLTTRLEQLRDDLDPLIAAVRAVEETQTTTEAQ